MPPHASSAQQIRHDYFMYMCHDMHAVGSGEPYYCLMNALYKMPFRWVLALDENRAMDGLGIRAHYENMHMFQETDLVHEAMETLGECSVLEMLVALSERISDQIGCRPHIWFWEMLENLNLTQFSDHDFNRRGGVDKIREMVDIFMDRKFAADGTGSPFPLEDPKKDQRDVEIWYQMQAYLMERYEV
ncbi:MAG: hypothetical protein [Chaetfec virus UA24_144]|nr:MAG: hypothetical protein [Chaetfec virus UA24_144]